MQVAYGGILTRYCLLQVAILKKVRFSVLCHLRVRPIIENGVFLHLQVLLILLMQKHLSELLFGNV